MAAFLLLHPEKSIYVLQQREGKSYCISVFLYPHIFYVFTVHFIKQHKFIARSWCYDTLVSGQLWMENKKWRIKSLRQAGINAMPVKSIVMSMQAGPVHFTFANTWISFCLSWYWVHSAPLFNRMTYLYIFLLLTNPMEKTPTNNALVTCFSNKRTCLGTSGR